MTLPEAERHTAVERIWHIWDSQDQLGIPKALKAFSVVPFWVEECAVTLPEAESGERRGGHAWGGRVVP